jgi:tRNA 5-methylaminomethyl-2-thiouridine biosynthesis bifunctional protein
MWQQQAAWTLLDTAFDCNRFLALWQCWRTHPQRSQMLHCVALIAQDAAQMLQSRLQQAGLGAGPEAVLAAKLALQCYALRPGFHRILLDSGQLSLTLCVGNPEESLAELDLQAQWVCAHDSALKWDKWQLKALARVCCRDAWIEFSPLQGPGAGPLAAAGFVAEPEDAGASAFVRFAPHWNLRHPRYTSAPTHKAEPRCAVIGAGLAGASVARALATRGWLVDVYEQGASPAAGASGLPAGLVVPHHSADDSPRSRMSRAGVRLMLDHAQRHLQHGKDWCRNGALEMQLESPPPAMRFSPADWSSAGASHLQDQAWAHDLAQPEATLWHEHAAWIKPAQLVRAWLNHPRIRFLGLAHVQALQTHTESDTARWSLLDGDAQVLGHADHVVFANARGCIELIRALPHAATPVALIPGLLEKLDAMQTLHGTLSLGRCDGASDPQNFPPCAVNGHGSFLSGIPSPGGWSWYCGSTFETDAVRATDVAAAQASNFQKLSQLLPRAAQALETQFTTGQAQAWAATRCVSHDRLPLVGPVDDAEHPTLWVSAAMGARGLSFSALCAEMLVALMGHEPQVMERALTKGLHSQRLQRRLH